MSVRLELKEFQIALLELCAAGQDPESVHIPGYVRHGFGGDWSGAYAERKRAQQRREHRLLLQRIAYLKRQHYFELVKEGEQRLWKLTSKGKFEVLRLRFVEHMMEARNKKWDRRWRIMIFDIPEWKKKYRDFMRRLLKGNGFQMWQFSVWVTKYNPEPALRKLLKYLGLHQYYSIIEADCKKCSPHLVKTWRQMRREQETRKGIGSERSYYKLRGNLRKK